MLQPEKITILEGPTPDFRPNGQVLFQSVLEANEDASISTCEMRTANGDSIRARCQQAWSEGRPVQLDFPDEMRMRRQVDVVAMRLKELDEGTVLMLWVRWPLDESDILATEDDSYDEGDFDDDGSDFSY